MIVTIDGPAGSGKSTAARRLAERLGIAYLDTGAMYRAATLAAIRRRIDLADHQALADLVRDIDIGLDCGRPGDGGQTRVFLDGLEVTRDIRSAEVSEKTSRVAPVPGVRNELVAHQRRIGAELVRAIGGVVSEGRDQGSVVFPDADAKFFLDASPEVRARRRHQEMAADGETITYEQVLHQIVTRDGADRSRAVAPLIVPDNAQVLDTSGMDIDAVVDWLADRVREKRPR
ncbi:MAG: Cytidylate kinase [Phycisphaerae bacterium]|nr:Cytidylate kinase [Phycisphaerae bacterium]